MCKILERVICYNEWIGLNWIGLDWGQTFETNFMLDTYSTIWMYKSTSDIRLL